MNSLISVFFFIQIESFDLRKKSVGQTHDTILFTDILLTKQYIQATVFHMNVLIGMCNFLYVLNLFLNVVNFQRFCGYIKVIYERVGQDFFGGIQAKV